MKPLQVIFSILVNSSFSVRTVSDAIFNDSEKPSVVEVAKQP